LSNFEEIAKLAGEIKTISKLSEIKYLFLSQEGRIDLFDRQNSLTEEIQPEIETHLLTFYFEILKTITVR